MKRMFWKGLSLAIVLAMCLAMAATALANQVVYTPVAGPDSVTLYDYLVAERTATILSYEFTFTLEAGSAATNVKAGPTVTEDGKIIAPSVGSVTITSADKLESLTTKDEAALGNHYNEGDVVLREEIALDFSGVQFDAPGVYRYVLTQETGSTPGVSYDANDTRYVDVYVQNKLKADGSGDLDEGKLVIQGTVVHTDGEKAGFVYNVGEDQSMPNIGVKDEAFVNGLDTVNLTLQKLITGNQADMDATFDFELEVELPAGAANGTFAITALTTDGTVTANGTFTTANGKGTGTVTLRKGGKITVYGLPYGTKVTISEDKGKYTASYVVGTGASVESDTTTELTLNADTSVVFTNTLEGIIPTGVLLTIAPFAALMIIGLVGVLIMIKKKSGK